MSFLADQVGSLVPLDHVLVNHRSDILEPRLAGLPSEGGPGFAPGEARSWGALVWLRSEMPAASVLAAEGHGGSVVLRAGKDGAEAEIRIGGASLKLATGAPHRGVLPGTLQTG